MSGGSTSSGSSRGSRHCKHVLNRSVKSVRGPVTTAWANAAHPSIICGLCSLYPGLGQQQLGAVLLCCTAKVVSSSVAAM
jgi:hypothetical protein